MVQPLFSESSSPSNFEDSPVVNKNDKIKKELIRKKLSNSSIDDVNDNNEK